jgi:DNA-nicking Smr family endonuclease
MAHPPDRSSPGRGSADDAALWRAVTKDLKPLRRRDMLTPVTTAPAAKDTVDQDGSAQAPLPPPVRPAPPPPSSSGEGGARADVLAPGVAPGFDKRTVQRLRRGQISPDGLIDLHRMTQTQAYGALSAFLAASQSRGRRCVLVITGKGYGSDVPGGVLRSAVPRWLNEEPNRPRVLAFTYATAPHGGEGALYVLLRRLRTP